MEIRMASAAQLTELTELVLQLWPDHDREAMKAELAQSVADDDAAYFLAWEKGIPVGFAQCRLRRDYVEGTESSPVGYLEGIYVNPECRRRGYARELLSACEEWARKKNCREFASDCELENLESLRFHLEMGFLKQTESFALQKDCNIGQNG